MRGYYGIGIYHPKTEENMGTLWRSAFLYNASFIFTIGKRYKKQCTDTVLAYKHVPLYNYISFDEFYRQIPYDCRLVCIEMDDKATPLNTFSHPERSIYLLGAEDYGIPKIITSKNLTVQIPMFKPISMNVAVAGSIVMYDRLIKTL